jgi:hypothetical protein
MQHAGRIVWRGLALRAPVDAPGASDHTAPPPLSPRTPPPEPTEPHAEPWALACPGGQAASMTRWVMAMPDVYSIRHTTVEDQVLPIVHEVKVRRADLLSDLRQPAKGEAYRGLASECWYVLKAGIGGPEDIPPAFGVMWAHPVAGRSPDAPAAFGTLEVLRPAPRRPFRMPLAVWMALARADALPPDDDPPQALLGDCD